MNTVTLPVAPGSEMPTGKLAQAILTVHEHLVAQFGDPNEYTTSYVLAPNDEYGWADDESPVLQWEEGPYEWAHEVSSNDEIRARLRAFGYHVEACTSWGALAFYRN